MPDVDPVVLEAIDETISTRDTRAEWDPKEMRDALIRVEKGENQEDIVEDKDFTQPVLSKQKNRLDEMRKEVRRKREDKQSMFEDPIQKAVGDFEQFFLELDEKYDFGINSMVLDMMKDEIKDSGELPAPMFVGSFLKETASGVGNQSEIEYIQRRYQNWLDDYAQELQGHGNMNGMGSYSGQPVGQGNQSGGFGGSGVPIGGGGNQQQQEGGQQGGGDRLARLEQQVEKLTEVVAQQQQSESSNGQTVSMEVGDGQQVEMDVDNPMMAMMLMENMGGGSDDQDMLSKLQQAKEAGLVLGPEHLQQQSNDEEMAQALQQSIEKISQQQIQAQQQMSQNFQSAISEIKEMQEETEEVSADDVREIMQEEMTKSEVEQVKEEMDERFSQLAEAINDDQRNVDPRVEDPDVIKQRNELEFRQKQMENVSDNLRYAMDQLNEAMQIGFVPALKEMDFGGSGKNKPVWTPPGQQQRPPAQPQQPPRQQQSQQEYDPTPTGQPDPAPPEEEGEPEEMVTHEQADELREKLGIGGGADVEDDEE